MSWAYGIDRNGREIGYAIGATCDWPGCTEEIDRGLSYACGDEHDESEVGCAGYYCGKHRRGERRLVCVSSKGGYRYVSVCNDCAKPPSKRRKVALVFSEPGELINDIIGDICDLPANKDRDDQLRVSGDALRAILRKRLRDRKLADALRALVGPAENSQHETAVPNNSPVTIRCQLGDLRRAWAALSEEDAGSQ